MLTRDTHVTGKAVLRDMFGAACARFRQELNVLARAVEQREAQHGGAEGNQLQLWIKDEGRQRGPRRRDQQSVLDRYAKPSKNVATPVGADDPGLTFEWGVIAIHVSVPRSMTQQDASIDGR